MRLAFWRTGPLADYSNDELSTVALGMLFPGGTGTCRTVAECDRRDEYIAAMRSKFEDHPEPRLRRQIIGWLNYAQAKVLGDRDRIREYARLSQLAKVLEGPP